uniref:dTTP/UTP pyrophosphatase n=1 Tax=Chlorobium chlorochromatii (strain CaD3) TaxID=340177 RepID=NTPPA_CHLCH|nr:RecName: Full=dTTP/UTP pyrophosphatase; Short=dTTPase/UTPase; AltName: Full=Nucleoside triphosphate pyrophosphatase; AltName: Full=Nucleotide pyrophosphatase; Short=Nucleotide PPase [Chlorobium chlorochromatii CaD3]
MNLPYPIILASQSPRRRELLALTLLPFETMSVNTPETLNPTLSPEENVLAIAHEKADAVATILAHTKRQAIVLTADTMVAQGRHIFGKPSGFDEAFSMLQHLQGKTHQVHTGFTLRTPTINHSEYVTTHVTLNAMSSEAIAHYLHQQQPYDKAGSYGIQDPLMACHISSINGCYYNVVGLPLSRVWLALQAIIAQQ